MRARLAMMVVVVSAQAQALEISVRGEPSVAFAVSAPQREYFSAGFGVFGAGELSVASIFDVVLETGYVFLARRSDSPLPSPGSAFWLGPGARVHTPFAGASFSVWLEVIGALVGTGNIFRPGVKIS